MHFTTLRRTSEMELVIRTWKRKSMEKHESLVNFRRIYICIFMYIYTYTIGICYMLQL